MFCLSLKTTVYLPEILFCQQGSGLVPLSLWVAMELFSASVSAGYNEVTLARLCLRG